MAWAGYILVGFVGLTLATGILFLLVAFWVCLFLSARDGVRKINHWRRWSGDVRAIRAKRGY